jgi:hypothetical protein
MARKERNMGRVLIFLRNAWFLVFMVLLAGGIVYGFVLFLGGDGTTTTMAGPTTTPASLAAAPSVIPPTTSPLPATPPYHDLPTTTVPTYVPGTQVIAAGTPAAIATLEAMRPRTATPDKTTRTPTPTPAKTVTIAVPGKDYGVASPSAQVVVSGTWGSGPGQFGAAPREGLGPEGFYVDAQGNVYVLDNYNGHRVQRFDSKGNFLGSFPFPGGLNIGVSDDGSVYVLDSLGTHKLYRYSSVAYCFRKRPLAIPCRVAT